jgi:thiol:disulfide interchange protein DsbC
MLKSIAVAALMLVAAPIAAQNAEQTVRESIKKLVPGATVDDVRKAELPGFYEVMFGGQVVYVTADGKYLLTGNVWDTSQKKNLTETRYAEVRQAALKGVPADKRIIFPAKTPKHTITVFTDIDCGYCRHMHQAVADYNRIGISIEYLFFPRAGRGSEAWNKAIAVWCAADPRDALTKAKAGQPIEMKTTCPNPIESDYELGQKIGLSGTPAVIAKDGTQIGGYLPPDQMLTRLDQLEQGGG